MGLFGTRKNTSGREPSSSAVETEATDSDTGEGALQDSYREQEREHIRTAIAQHGLLVSRDGLNRRYDYGNTLMAPSDPLQNLRHVLHDWRIATGVPVDTHPVFDVDPHIAAETFPNQSVHQSARELIEDVAKRYRDALERAQTAATDRVTGRIDDTVASIAAYDQVLCDLHIASGERLIVFGSWIVYGTWQAARFHTPNCEPAHLTYLGIHPIDRSSIVLSAVGTGSWRFHHGTHDPKTVANGQISVRLSNDHAHILAAALTRSAHYAR